MSAAKHAQRVLSSLNQQRAAGKFCDAALNVGGGAVYLAHRNILACFSELFQQSSVSPEPSMAFSFQECPYDGVELLLNFVYTGELKLDPDNVSKVQHAATTLCVQEALELCHQFKEKSVKAVPYKRKRGRPRKSDTHTTCCSATDENLPTVAKEESCTDAASLSAATTTTTRSGRLVKGPRRLVTDESTAADVVVAENTSKRPLPVDKASGDVDSVNTDQPTGELQGNEIKTNDSGVKEDDDGDHERINDDSDEEYVPLPGSSAASTTEQSRSDQTANRKKVDSKKDSVQCHVCDKSFKSKYYLKVHNRRHTGEKPFVCLKCGKRYFRKENLLIHEFKNCTRAKTYTCSTCSLVFKGKEELRVHITSHTGDMPYKCSTCPEQFVYKKNLTHHMMKVHGHAKPHACAECPKTFLSRSELRVHEAAKHRGEKPFVCEECGHRASSRNGLQMHIKAIHRNERPFVCNVCGHAFSQKNNLNMHLRVHSGERPYQCHFCGKTFRTQGSLDKHHRTHTGERPFSCDVCEQRFTEKGALLRHKASKHEEGRPHGCHICSKTFKAKEQLRVHLRRHKGMRKFECANCGYKFTRQAHLRRHVQIHKRTENYNPRQRKLRNVIVQEVDGSTSQNEAVEASLIAEGAEFVQVVQDPTQPETSLGSTCVVRVMIDAAEEDDDEATCGQNLGHVEAMQSFSVPEVLQQTQLVTKAYESTIHMEEMVENMTQSSA